MSRSMSGRFFSCIGRKMGAVTVTIRASGVVVHSPVDARWRRGTATYTFRAKTKVAPFLGPQSKEAKEGNVRKGDT
jgi:hypothetical protein